MPPCTGYSVQSAHNTTPEYSATVAVLSSLETYTDIKHDSPSLDPRYDTTIPLHRSGDNASQTDSLEHLNHSPIGNTRPRATSSHWSLRTTSIASYKETVTDILKRGSRTSSCVSDIVSLLGRFSLHQSKNSLCDSTHSGSVHKRSSLAETISHRRLLTPSSATVVEDQPLSGQIISRHRVLEQHIETVQKHNTALLSTCRGCLQSQDCVHRRIIQATSFGIQPSTDFVPLQSVVGTHCHYTQTDCYGNNLLFFAARLGVPLFVLLEIIQNTPDLNSLNTDGHNFLFVLDTLGFDCSRSGDCDFTTLLDVLEQRRFNFDHLDHNGRSFLLFLCLRPGFRISWIALLFQRDQEWQWRIKRFARQKDSLGEYMSGYLAGQPDLSTLHRDVLSIICEPLENNWKRFNGRTKLHDRVIEHLELYVSYYSKQTHTNQRNNSSLIYSYGWDGNDIDNYDSDGYTPLALFVYKALNKYPPVSDNYIVCQIQGLVGWGANINARCRNGDTVLHLAARKSNFKVLQCLTSYSIHINHQNDAGIRAIDLLPSNPTFSSSTWRRFITQEPALQCLLLLQDHGSRPYFMLS
jgi:hypothetical protein